MIGSCTRFKLISAFLFFSMRSYLARLGISYDLSSIANTYYRKKFDRIPAAQKAVILPHCLTGDKCPARFSKEDGILCVKCKQCNCGDICNLAEEQGWQFYITPSSGFAKRLVKRKMIGAAIGAACNFEIERSIRFTRINAKGVHLRHNRVIPQFLATFRYNCLHNDIDWEHLKRIIRGEIKTCKCDS
jgi:hypothetical protein